VPGMPERSSYQPGTPSWVDLASADPDASAEFYGGLFGWEATPPNEDFGGYRQFHLRGKPVAGMAPLMNPGQPSVWSTYFATDSASETTARVDDAGGEIMFEASDVGDLGRMAIFSDIAGAPFGVWEPKQFAGAAIVNEPGTLSWNELMTRDPGGAKQFYPAVFGWKTEDMDMDPGTYTVWNLGEEPVGGMMPMGDRFPTDVPPHWMVYFAVEDTDAAVEKVKELGGSVSVPPADIPDVGRFAVVADPNGSFFSIIKIVRQPQNA
jgi:predicted enzyme related to lactoylglutathione lyase